MIAAVVIEGVLLLVALVALVLRERDREKDRATERDQYLAQFADLCQRIQAPSVAVTDHSIQAVVSPVPQAVGFDDDEGYWRSSESKEQLAERMMREEVEAARANGRGE